LQILFLNLVTDVFPALALGLGEGEKDIMKYPPRPVDEPIMPRPLWITTIVYGLCITAGVLGITLFAHFYLDLDPARVNNMAFYTLVLGQLLNIFNLPKRGTSFFNNEVTRTPWVWGAILLCLLLTGLGYLIEPLREILSLVPLQWTELGWVVVFSVASLALAQLVKRMGGTV
jgi:Ca2+-transporting ATPase